MDGLEQNGILFRKKQSQNRITSIKQHVKGYILNYKIISVICVSMHVYVLICNVSIHIFSRYVSVYFHICVYMYVYFSRVSKSKSLDHCIYSTLANINNFFQSGHSNIFFFTVYKIPQFFFCLPATWTVRQFLPA